MSQWTHGDHQPDPESHDEDAGYVRRSRILYWWPSPVGTEKSAAVGKSMLRGTIAWFAVLVVVILAIAVLLAVVG